MEPKREKATSARVLRLPSARAAQDRAQDAKQEVPAKFVGKWVGVSGKMAAESRNQVGTAVVREDFGHTIDQFQFEVAKDGTVKKLAYEPNTSLTGTRHNTGVAVKE